MRPVAEVLLLPAQVTQEQVREAQARHRKAEGAADLAAAVVEEGMATAILVQTTKQIQIKIYKTKMMLRLWQAIENEPTSTALKPPKTTSGQTLLLVDPRPALIPYEKLH
jgi:hypothetical protein